MSSLKSDSLLPSISKKPVILRKIVKSVSNGQISLPNIKKRYKLSNAYKYRVLPGNNSRIILLTLRKRPWWHSAQVNSENVDPADEFNFPKFIWQMYKNTKQYQDSTYKHILLNHIQQNQCLVSKKGLYICLRDYCIKSGYNFTDIAPLTFYISSDSCIKDDRSEFIKYNEYHSNDVSSSSDPTTDIEENIWILKPASNTNRGYGIQVVQGIQGVFNIIDKSTAASSNSETDKLTKEASKRGKRSGWIVQKYMHNPLLVHGRKFDIRCYCLVTNFHRQGLKAYFFDDMYVRTSGKKYSLSKLEDRETHLTNDAVQKHSKTYGKFESGNKLTMSELQGIIADTYLDAPVNVVFDKIIPSIEQHITTTILAAQDQFSETCIQNSFELFGYDFMIDSDFKVKIIEINTNPCLEFACPMLTELITSLIEHVFRVAIDPICLPPPVSQRTPSCQEAIDIIQADPIRFKQIFPELK